MRFTNQYSSTSHMGAIEIIESVAYFLAEIYKKTGMLPRTVLLDNVALTVGENDLIKLIPPLDLVMTPTWERVANELFSSLKAQDPISRHENQIEAFKKKFAEQLEND